MVAAGCCRCWRNDLPMLSKSRAQIARLMAIVVACATGETHRSYMTKLIIARLDFKA